MGAALSQRVGWGEEQLAEIEERLGSRGQEAAPGQLGDRGEALGDIGAAGENHGRDLDPQRRLRRASVVTAIENLGEARLGHGIARGVDERLPPASAGIDPGVGGAEQDDGSVGRGGGFKRRDCVS